ncbi:MAG: tetratricopeptide repeat protein, partial [Phycisphaerae bacterium]
MLRTLLGRQPEVDQAWLALAEQYVRTAQWSRAARAYDRYLKLRPDSAAARTALAEVLLQTGQYQRAERLARQVGLDQPGSALLWCRARLRQLVSTPRPDRVALDRLARQVQTLAGQFPRHVGFRLVLAEIARASADPARAARLLEQAKQDCDDPVAASLALAELYHHDQPDRAIQELSAAVAAAPRQAEPRIQLARLYATNGQLSAAERLLRDGLAAVPDEQSPAVAVALSQLLQQDGRPKAARQVLKAATQRHPYDLRLRQLLLHDLIAAGQLDDARPVLEQIRQIEGQDGLIWRYEQARLLLARSDWSDQAAHIAELLKRCLKDDPAWPEPALALADLQQRQGRFDAAIRTYRQLLELRPGSVQIARKLIRLLERSAQYDQIDQVLAGFADHDALLDYRIMQAWRRGDNQRLARLLERKIAARPDDVASRCRLVNAYLDLDDPEKAERLLRQIERLDPFNIDLVRARVRLQLQRADAPAAIAACNEFIQRVGGFDACRLRADTRQRLGRITEAEADYRRLTQMPARQPEGWLLLGNFLQAQGRGSEAIDAWRRAAQLDTNLLEARYRLIMALLESGRQRDRQEARELLGRLLREHPADSTGLLIKARLLLRGGPGKERQASEILRQIVQRDPYSVGAWTAMVQLASQRGLHTEAAATLERALAANPRSLELMLMKVDLLLASKPLLAVSVARQALRLQPDSGLVRVKLAQALIAAGQNEAALKSLAEWLGRATGVSALPGLLFYAQQLQQAGRSDRARQILTRAVDLAPQHRLAVLARLELLISRGQLDEAIKLARHVRQTRSDQPSLLMDLAGIMLRQRPPSLVQEARQLFAYVASRQPGSVAPRLGMAVAAHKLGQVDEAEQAFRAALKLSPDNAVALNGLAWLLSEQRNQPQAALEIVNRALKRLARDP